MIIVNLKGGLGNQMFQYAAGRALSIKNKLSLKLDVTGYRPRNYNPGDTVRAFGLSHFNIKAEVATDEEVRKAKYPFGIFSKAARFLRAKVFRVFYTDYHPDLVAKITPSTKSFYLDGFFQTDLYFKDIKNTIQDDLSLNAPLSAAAQEAADRILERGEASVSLHIRRGDYVSNAKTQQAHGTVTLDYYHRAIAAIAERVKAKKPGMFPTFFIFSDDIEWAKENIRPEYETVYVSRPEIADYEEMHVMSLCQSHIVANSTFSWWAAWLDRHDDALVIAPKKWSNVVPDDHPNIIPRSWVRM